MNDRVILRGRTTMPFGARRQCDVCGLLEAEHPEPLGNDCYRRIVAARFPMSAPARWAARRSPLEVRRATESGTLLQGHLAGLWRALGHAPVVWAVK
ncbi:MAG TPA: hypothetical protein VFI41_05105 [Gemmatimonadales bacterium]|nr:hypothetical protein [Gemmatimonadales bacterium]